MSMDINNHGVPVGGAYPASKATRTGRMLTEEQLEVLARTFPPPYAVGTQTSVLEAGFMLGVAAVMQRLREGV